MLTKQRKFQYLITFSVSIASLTVAVSSAWLTPVIPMLTKNETHLNMTKDEISVMVALNCPGFLVGSLVTRFLADYFGRRLTILASAVPIAVGTIFVVLSTHSWMLYMTRFFWGFGTGIVGTMVPFYLTEIADKEIRATLYQCTSVMFNLGSLLVMSIGPFVSFQTLNYSLVALPIAYFMMCLWIPETPQFLLKEGQVAKARNNIMMIKGVGDDAAEEVLSSLKEGVNKDMRKASSAWELFTGRQYRKPLVISAGLKISGMLSGGMTIQQYLGYIMKESKANISLEVILIVFGVVRFLVGIMSSILIDRIGRRPLLFYSYTGVAISLIISGIYFFLQEVILINREELSPYGWIVFACILASTIISSLGFSSLINIIPAEIFPLNVKAVAMTANSVLGGILGFLSAIAYRRLEVAAGHCGVFWAYAFMAIFGAFFVYFYVPETKGLSLDEIVVMLQGEKTVQVDVEMTLKEEFKEGNK